MKIKLLLIVLLLGCLYGVSYAGGFQLNEHGARPMGMGGAFTAVADDPSAVYWNGAGLSWIEGTNFTAGGTMITPTASFRGVYPSVKEWEMVDQSFFPVNFFASHKIDDKFAVGFGFTVPFGLGSEWDENWEGRYLAVKTDLMVFTMSPVVAYKVLDNLSLSAGFVYSFANVKIAQKSSQSPFQGDAFIHLEGKDNSSFGYNLGAMYKPIPELSFGVSFHSEIDYAFKGTATTTGAPQLTGRLPFGNVVADLTTPLNLAIGVAYDVVPKLKISADFQYIGWKSYDTLGVDFEEASLKDIASPRLYDNSFIIRFGAEYKLLDNLNLLGGVYFDKNPVKPEYLNPSLPDADRVGLSFGLAYDITNKIGVSASYLFIRGSQITVDNSHESYTQGFTAFNGTYNTYANLFALNFSYGL